MKKIFALIVAMAIAGALAAPVFAQGSRSCRSYETSQRSARTYYDNSRVYDNGQVYGYRDRSFWDRHRNKLTIAIGTGAGAAIGGLIGGKRGAVIGAASGLGASALYTYKLRNRRIRF